METTDRIRGRARSTDKACHKFERTKKKNEFNGMGPKTVVIFSDCHKTTLRCFLSQSEKAIASISATRTSFPALTTSSCDCLNGLIVRIHSHDLLKTDQTFEVATFDFLSVIF